MDESLRNLLGVLLFIYIGWVFTKRPRWKKDATRNKKGKEFESQVLNVFLDNGWQGSLVTQAPQFGVDLIVTSPKNKVYVVECKNHEKPIGNGVVRSIASSRLRYKAHHSIVISAVSPFTSPAKDQAKTSRVILLEFKELDRWLEKRDKI
jgi:HJR/Mrr/RecB family endonuclease